MPLTVVRTDSSIEEVLTLAHEFTQDIEIAEAPLFIQRLSLLADAPHRAPKGGDGHGLHSEGGARHSMLSEVSDSRVKRPSTQLSMLGDAGLRLQLKQAQQPTTVATESSSRFRNPDCADIASDDRFGVLVDMCITAIPELGTVRECACCDAWLHALAPFAALEWVGCTLTALKWFGCSCLLFARVRVTVCVCVCRVTWRWCLCRCPG